MKWVWLVLLAPAVMACVVPESGMRIDESAVFCADVLSLEEGLTISGENINVQCDGTVFKSWSGGKGISIEHATNVTVSGCRLISYDIGLYVRNSSHVFLQDNHLVKNKVGTRFVVVSKSATRNHDVSLQAPFELLESEGNAISLTNKVVEGEFCKTNYCNKDRGALDMFLLAQTPSEDMAFWLGDQVAKDAAQALFERAFGSLFS